MSTGTSTTPGVDVVMSRKPLLKKSAVAHSFVEPKIVPVKLLLAPVLKTSWTAKISPTATVSAPEMEAR